MVCSGAEAEEGCSGLGRGRNETLMEGQPITNSPHTGRFRVARCIGIDVSKQSLELGDGTHHEKVPNEKGLTTLKKFLRKRCGTNQLELEEGSSRNPQDLIPTICVHLLQGMKSGWLK
jgi:hypothetical protein